MPLERRKTLISSVFFIDAGIASMVANGSIRSNQMGIEVGIIGREGMTGLSVVLSASERSVYDTFMQVAGAGRRIPTGRLIDAISLSVTLHRPMLAYAHSFVLQASTTALANGRGKLEERLARWLLLAHDRIDGDVIVLTHELLGVMLAAHRPGVTLAVQALEVRGLISAKRGQITILDRIALSLAEISRLALRRSRTRPGCHKGHAARAADVPTPRISGFTICAARPPPVRPNSASTRARSRSY